MSDFENVTKFNNEFKTRFKKMQHEAIEISAVQHYSFNMSKEETEAATDQWQKILETINRSGKKVKKLQACAIPLSSELKEMVEWAVKTIDMDNVQIEEWYFVTLDSYLDIAKGWGAQKEFWLFDENKEACIINFSKEGKVEDWYYTNNDDIISKLVTIKDALMKIALSAHDFSSAYVK